MTALREVINVEIIIGATFGHIYTWTDDDGDLVDLSGFSATWILTSAVGATLHTASVANGQIVLGGAAGTAEVVIAAAATAAFSASHGNHYELVFTSPSGEKTSLAAGHVNIRAPG